MNINKELVEVRKALSDLKNVAINVPNELECFRLQQSVTDHHLAEEVENLRKEWEKGRWLLVVLTSIVLVSSIFSFFY